MLESCDFFVNFADNELWLGTDAAACMAGMSQVLVGRVMYQYED